MKISRIWTYPSRWTFSISPILRLLARYHAKAGWADPFAGIYSPAEWTNDIEGRGAMFQMDGLEFLKSRLDGSCRGVLFDPPYSVEQCLRKYSPRRGGTAGMGEYWARCKDEIERIVKVGGYSISFGWDSNGTGKIRGFEIVEILLVCHGSCHRDTIVTVDQKVR